VAYEFTLLVTQQRERKARSAQRVRINLDNR